jgi:hypothetical protein
MHTFERWREGLQFAPNAEAVQSVVDDYLNAIRSVIGLLPPDCQRCLRAPMDIQDAAVTLLQAELRFNGSAETAAVLHEVARTFAVAAVRITQLHGKSPPAAD